MRHLSFYLEQYIERQQHQTIVFEKTDNEIERLFLSDIRIVRIRRSALTRSARDRTNICLNEKPFSRLRLRSLLGNVFHTAYPVGFELVIPQSVDRKSVV